MDKASHSFCKIMEIKIVFQNNIATDLVSISFSDSKYFY